MVINLRIDSVVVHINQKVDNPLLAKRQIEEFVVESLTERIATGRSFESRIERSLHIYVDSHSNLQQAILSGVEEALNV